LCKISSNQHEFSEIRHEPSSLNSYLRNSSTTCDHEGFCESRRRGIEVSFKSVKKKKKIPIYFRFPTYQKALIRIFVRISILIQVYSQESSRLHFKSSSKTQGWKWTVNQSESFEEIKKIQNETLIWKSHKIHRSFSSTSSNS
jgi:hypothetical protein